MAHLMKANRGSIGGLSRHFERYKNEQGKYLKFGNQDIDTSKTHLNYNLAEDKNQLEFIKKRTGEVKCLNRKDVNVMASWVITLPEKIESEEERELFFQESYKFLENEYGKENVISSYVHLDETTPHMHFSFIPVVYDEMKKEYKVSAKELINRQHLQDFHPNLERYMNKVFGRDIGILNEMTKEGNKSIKELKEATAIEKIESLEEVNKNLISQHNDIVGRVNDLQSIYKDKEKGLMNTFESNKKALESKLEGLNKVVKGTQLNLNQIMIIKPQKTITGAIKGVSLEDIEDLKTTALVSVKTLSENKNLLKENERLTKRIKILEGQVPSIADRLKDAKERSRYEEIEKAFNKLPNEIKKELLNKKTQEMNRGYER